MTRSVVHLVEDLGLGGMERVLQRLAREQRTFGWDVRVLCTRAGGPVAEAMTREGLSVRVLGLPSSPRLVAVGCLVRAFRPLRPFFLHTHGAARAAGRLAGRVAGAHGIIHHLHGTESYGWRQRMFERCLPADAYLACSQAVREQFLQAVGPLPVEVLYNPVDTDRYRFAAGLRHEGRALLQITDERPVILTIGRFVPEKGQTRLMEAIPGILERHPNVVFVFIGDGPVRQAVERQGARYGGTVRFLGLVQDPLPYLNGCDVYVQPSVGREGLGLALLEAMACERPVVATAIQGLREAVGSDGAGVLVPQGDAHALSNAIGDLLDNPSSRAVLGRRAREKVLRTFSLKEISCRLEEVYRRLGVE